MCHDLMSDDMSCIVAVVVAAVVVVVAVGTVHNAAASSVR